MFWTPNILVHWIAGYRFSGYITLGLTIFLPVITILFFRKVWPPLPKPHSLLSQALFAVLGIWIAGPAMLTFSSSFCGGGLTQPDAWRFFVFGTLLFPVFTLVMSAYDGTFFAVLLTTVLLPLFLTSRAKKALPPVIVIDRRIIEGQTRSWNSSSAESRRVYGSQLPNSSSWRTTRRPIPCSARRGVPNLSN